MAHVLLPCDLPHWSEVQKLLLKLRSCTQGAAARIMAEMHEISSVSLDPDDSGPILGHPGFERLGTFLSKENLPGRILPEVAEWASKLPTLKPGNGIHYSLRAEERPFYLDRALVVSLLANAFFSTFPRRKSKTHPTLLDFSMADFFTHLDRDSHQRKLRALLHYFENLEPEPDGVIQFTRKVLRGPTLPGWLCSERPLVPLVVRPQGRLDDAEPWVFRGCACASSVGGDVLKESTCQEECVQDFYEGASRWEESEVLFEFPELLSTLCFVESLVEEEALIVEGLRAPNTQEVNFCFLDSSGSGQFEDKALLQSLNKAVAAFSHDPRFVDRRRTPDGEESGDGARHSEESEEERIETMPERLRRTEGPRLLSSGKQIDKSLSQASSKFSMKTASEASIRAEDEYYTADEESEPESAGRSAEGISSSDHPRRQSSTSSVHSFGFVLGQSEDEEDMSLLNRHERLEDFRRRIRRRTRRRLSRKSSSYSSGGSSSDMEDISEDLEENFRPPITVRPACSEPSLVNLESSVADMSPWISPDVLLSPSGHKQLAATCSGGHLKSYSHDGVRPNLPVPFRARFRVRRTSSGSRDLDESRSPLGTEDKGVPYLLQESSRCPVAVTTHESDKDPQLRALVLWLAASMAQLPALILYTVNEPKLQEVIQVYNQVLNRQWTVGDLACEVLRFCRNQITPGLRESKHTHLFGQLMADKNSKEQPAPKAKIFTEESLD